MSRRSVELVSGWKDTAVWVVRLSDKQLEAVKALLAAEQQLGPALSRALESLELARWDELPDAELPWGQITSVAAEQGVSEADVVWDRCGRRASHQEGATPAKGKRSGAARSG